MRGSVNECEKSGRIIVYHFKVYIIIENNNREYMGVGM
jgi:hypothetical protein